MKLFKLKTVLTGYSEEVSRTILVSVDIDFEELHQNIQRAMGWQDEHLYAFKVREDEIRPDDALDINELDAGESIFFDSAKRCDDRTKQDNTTRLQIL